MAIDWRNTSQKKKKKIKTKQTKQQNKKKQKQKKLKNWKDNEYKLKFLSFPPSHFLLNSFMFQ